MFETLGLEMTPQTASVWFGLIVGLAFGALAMLTRFCLRRALIGPAEDRSEARGVWALALAVAVLGTQGAVAAGLVSFEAHRFQSEPVAVLGLVVGGLLFGLGTVLARGCLSRLTVLSATGNLRALVAILVAAVAAHATLQGALAPLRMVLGSVTLSLGGVPPGAGWIWAAVIAGFALLVVLRSRVSAPMLLGGALIGALVPLAWVGTGYVLYDEFDAIPLEGLAFTGPWAEALFWGVAASVTNAGFGAGLIGGVLAGSLVAALLSRRFAWESFDSAGQMGRSLGGAALMGVGGVLAGGCTVGAGLAGLPTLGIAALIAFVAIVAGILGADAVLNRRGLGRGVVPAE
ncbi:YeeE/YedE thiosulfate transporter family protein [Roseicyclus marinus]|uniref:YeeE/YedE thiosulfate transporter family protein n=1 Tax=Roseicyclus marinus TaxID=2161673 RepID=UPI00240F5E0D|nr:YeeE/YedE thiosulfate transporter family protein [Roseicyclus marinus]MDG3041221.1 YeeE/YedE thiosulfate transporter family protein [Roseicyclus marinus]